MLQYAAYLCNTVSVHAYCILFSFGLLISEVCVMAALLLTAATSRMNWIDPV
jgi:hypothetical protein